MRHPLRLMLALLVTAMVILSGPYDIQQGGIYLGWWLIGCVLAMVEGTYVSMGRHEAHDHTRAESHHRDRPEARQRGRGPRGSHTRRVPVRMVGRTPRGRVPWHGRSHRSGALARTPRQGRNFGLTVADPRSRRNPPTSCFKLPHGSVEPNVRGAGKLVLSSSRSMERRRCVVSSRERERNRPGTAARGYGSEHRKRRKLWVARVEQGGVSCWRCGNPILPGTPWDLGHDDLDRREYRGPEHVRCNRGTAGRGKRRPVERRALSKAWW